MKITAAVLREPTGRFEIEELDLADPRDDEVLVKMVGAGLCHTDLLSREWPPEMFPGPIVYGHEGSGIVEAVGTRRLRGRRGRPRRAQLRQLWRLCGMSRLRPVRLLRLPPAQPRTEPSGRLVVADRRGR